MDYISAVLYPSYKSQNKLTPNDVVSAYRLNFEGNRNVFFFCLFPVREKDGGHIEAELSGSHPSSTQQSRMASQSAAS